eukprot:289807-Pleurochrysis_carterae.AAC.1
MINDFAFVCRGGCGSGGSGGKGGSGDDHGNGGDHSYGAGGGGGSYQQSVRSDTTAYRSMLGSDKGGGGCFGGGECACDFPVIISVENHCPIAMQERMVQILTSILGEKLYVGGHDVSPHALRGR